MHSKIIIATILSNLLITRAFSNYDLPILFKSFGIENGLYSTEINDALLIDQTFRFFGSEGQGLINYRKGNFYNYGVPEGLRVPFVNALALYNSDSLLVASEHEVYFFSQRSKKFYLIATLENSLKIRKFVQFENRVYFLSNTGELFSFEKNTSDFLLLKSELKNIKKVFTCHLSLYVIQGDYTLSEWEDNSIKKVYVSKEKILNAIERNGIIYLFTSSKIIKIKNHYVIGEIRLHKPINQIYSLQKNKDYIVGLTGTNEIFLIDENDNQKIINSKTYIFRIFLFDNDELWVSENERLKCFLLNSIYSFTSFDYPVGKLILDKRVIHDNLYISFGKKVLQCDLNLGNIRLISDFFHTNTGIVFQILPWMDHSILFNTETGIYQWYRNQLLHYRLMNFPFDIGNIDVFYGQLSFLNDKGLLVYFKDKKSQYFLNNAWIKHYRISDSLLVLIDPDMITFVLCNLDSLHELKSYPFNQITSVHFDTISKAIWVFENATLHRICLKDFHKIEQRYFGTNPRLIETVGRDSLLVFSDELRLLIAGNSNSTAYTLKFSDWLTRNVQINAVVRHGNDIFIVSENGILKSESDDFLKPLKTHFKIEKLLVNGVQKFHNKPLTLRSFENTLSFIFEPVSDIFSETSFLFRFIIITDQKSDTVVSSVNELYLTNLIPNRYKVLYQLFTRTGELLDEGEISFLIKKPFYLTGYFLLSSSFAILLVVSIFIRWRMRQLKEKIALKEQLLETETKALRLQMNPHFLYNSLESIEGYILKADKITAVRHLNKFTRLMRLILEGSDKGFHSLKREIDLLKNYLDLEQMRAERSFEYEFEYFPDEKALENHQIPSMILQPHVENSIIHGLRPLKDRKGLIKISFYLREEEKIIDVFIEDNGVGRIKSSELPVKTDVKSKSLALKINKQRLEYLSQTSKKQLFIKIHDKMDVNGLPSGTIVHLVLPIVK